MADGRRWRGTFAAALSCIGLAMTLHAQRPPDDADVTIDILRSSQAITRPFEYAQVPVSPAVRDAAGQLDDPNWTVREAAMRTLLDPSVPNEQLYTLLAGGGLTVEQRYRLLNVVREHLIHAPRGAIGISMDMNPFGGNAPVEVRVSGLVPGLPAEKVLQIGDRITQVDGQVLSGSEGLMTYVQNKKPGERVTLNILRARTNDEGEYVRDAEDRIIYDAMQVEIALGSADLLRDTPGFPRRQSSVEMARRYEAETAAIQLAPRPRAVEIQGEDNVSFGSARVSAAVIPERIESTVEQHWAIQSILRDRYLISIGRKTDGPLVREQWENMLRSLWELSRRPDLSDENRELLQRVSERYSQLMNP